MTFINKRNKNNTEIFNHLIVKLKSERIIVLKKCNFHSFGS